MRLENKVALITGGASGIGRATAIRFAKEGAKVVVGDFNEENGKEVVDLIHKDGGIATFFKVVVSKFEEVENMVDFSVKKYGTLDVIFNNAGIAISKPLLEHEPEDYHQVVGVNQHGVYYGILAAARKMVELGVKGVIINTASVFGYIASNGVASYQAAKGAVIMLTKNASLELSPYGIRVEKVIPFFTQLLEEGKEQGYVDPNLSNEAILLYLKMLKEYIQQEDVYSKILPLTEDITKIFFYGIFGKRGE